MAAADIVFGNFGRAKLAVAPAGAGGLSFSLVAGKGALFPSPAGSQYFYGIFANAAKTVFEVVKVSARATDAFTIAGGGRGLDGTTAQTWTANDYFYYAPTALMFSEFFAHIAQVSAAHAASAIANTPAGNIAATDVQSALNELDGEKLALAGGSMTGALNVKQTNDAAEIVIVSSATPAIFAASGNNIAISGNVTVTGFDTIAAGARRRIRATGAFLLTNNANILCPGNVNINVQVGDTFDAVSQGAGVTQIEFYSALGGEFTTGDAKFTLKTVADAGWIMADDGTIGSATSGASNRANADTQALFTLLWNNVIDAWAPVVTGRGANAAADWAANKKITLTKTLGRAIAVAGAGASLTARALGQNLGEETHVLTTPEMPSHTHNSGVTITGSRGDGVSATATSGANSTGPTGGDGAHNNMQPSGFMNLMIKL